MTRHPKYEAQRCEALRELHQVVSDALNRAYDRDLTVDFALADDLNRALDLAVHLELALDLDLGRAFELYLGLDLEPLAGVLEEAKRGIAVRLQELAPDPAPAMPEGVRPPVQVQPNRLAIRVSGWATRMLPPTARARYGDELLDELHTMADDDAGRWRQLACAVRQAVPGAWQIRAALREEQKAPRASGEGW